MNGRRRTILDLLRDEFRRAPRWTAPLAVFLAFLAMDVYRISESMPATVFGDEWRYLYYADNLLHGFYSPPRRIFVWNGPGYPILLMPFVKWDWIAGARYANAVWHAGAMLYAWLLLRIRLSVRVSAAAVAVLGLYLPANEHLSLLYTEVICFFLLTAWAYHAIHAPKSARHLVVAGCYLAVLCLTKTVFGVVSTVFLVLLGCAWLYRRLPFLSSYVRQTALALVLCLPYLFYTYRTTGRVFYWSTGGASSFYWLTSPFPDEWGDWYHQGWVRQNPMLHAHHGELYARVTGLADDPTLSEMEQMFNMSTPQAADVLFATGLRNIREHPLKFARNWCANLVRLFMDVPVSVRETPVWNSYSICGVPLLAWTAFVALVAWRRRVLPPLTVWPIALFVLLTIGIYSFSSIVGRYLIPLVPTWWVGTCHWLNAARASAPLGEGQPIHFAPGAET